MPTTLTPPNVAARNRQRRITDKDAKKLETYEIDFRFVREVERLEREGRVRSRVTLEKDLGMSKGTISTVRAGHRGVGAEHLKRLKEKYNGDYHYILFGFKDPHDTSGPLRMGRRLDVHVPYTLRYAAPAAWKCGPRPEEDAAHYPDDPQNELHPWRVSGKPEKPQPIAPEQAPNYPAIIAALRSFEQQRRGLVGAPEVVYYLATNAKQIEGIELVIEERGYAKGRAYRAIKAAWHELLRVLGEETGVGVSTGHAPTPDARLVSIG
ncbi:hypothetical protein [Hymenobacter latericus]|uniref:hypothetical protein n=1 Tax=Hymenobacter sp. YIM 151858-1 TaxID=2987688 RepID=UPI002227458A|nr:hypothetical protein [Hymenobacter sp. YIM 151858-1]UYZ60057.1 hypothetical protein OIS50_04475 [Hymenobacter sp. YIM 151858-1]